MDEKEAFITVPSLGSTHSVIFDGGIKNSESRLLQTTVATRPNSQLQECDAVRKIEKWWQSVRDRSIFKSYKEVVCAAETVLTKEIIRTLSPMEATILQDSAMRARIKFRLGGESFPPTILYKLFYSKHLMHVHYISGKNMIRPSTEAAEDAHRLMSNRTLFNQILEDESYHSRGRKVHDEVDVATVKDYMQYRSMLDETPAYVGGKGNSWRRLDASPLTRYATTPVGTELLLTVRAEGKKPKRQDISRELASKGVAADSVRCRPSGATVVHGSGRRSWQARERVHKMKLSYFQQSIPPPAAKEASGLSQDSDWEDEALELYQWTKELSMKDMV